MDRFEKRSGIVGLAMVVFLGFLVGGLSLASGVIESVVQSEKKTNVLGEVAPSITPVITETPVLTPVQPVNPTGGSELLNRPVVDETTFDCVGPDGKVFRSTKSDCKKLNESWGKTMDYMMDSGDCNGGTIKIKKSEFDLATCCQIGNKSYFYFSKSKCKEDQNVGHSTEHVVPTYVPIPHKPLIDCVVTYPCTGNSFSYQLDQETCNTSKQRAIDGCPALTTTTNTNTTNVVKKVDTSACYAQYNYDLQRANMYGGNVGSAIKDMATNNLNRCLKSGSVTPVGAVEEDTRPRDRNGRLCSEYGPEAISYSQSMGCP